ncbi:CD1375 family protein [Streptococcus thermophilus]
MIVKLFAINVANGNFPFKRVPEVLKSKVKEKIATIVNDEEMLAQITQE